MQNMIKCTRMRPVRCNTCGNYEYLKMSGSNNIASFKCNMCRQGRMENQKKLNMQSSRNLKVECAPRSSHDKKK